MSKSIVKRSIIIFLSALVALAVLLFVLVWFGFIQLNGFKAAEYEVKGIDLSHYQGDVKWSVLAKENIDFAFIKATEGSKYVDECFEYNFEEAKKTELVVGAYHFFSFDSKGDTQADNFINTVKAFDGMLPPVVDFEFYGDKEDNPPPKETVVPELQSFIERIEEHYGTSPIIYATEESYKMYLTGGFEEYDIWIRNVITTPTLSDGRQWTFWQYSNRGRLDGYEGEERYIDLNIYNGSREEFEEYLKKVCVKLQ